jgi:hypothetical protein
LEYWNVGKMFLTALSSTPPFHYSIIPVVHLITLSAR